MSRGRLNTLQIVYRRCRGVVEDGTCYFARSTTDGVWISAHIDGEHPRQKAGGRSTLRRFILAVFTTQGGDASLQNANPVLGGDVYEHDFVALASPSRKQTAVGVGDPSPPKKHTNNKTGEKKLKYGAEKKNEIPASLELHPE